MTFQYVAQTVGWVVGLAALGALVNAVIRAIHRKGGKSGNV
jgi:hypothetical protein